MTTTPEPPPAHDDESGAADDRFDRRIAFGVVAVLAVVGAVGPFGWHLLSNTGGGSSASAGAAAGAAGNGGGGGAGSNGNAAVASPVTETSSASPASGNSAAESASASCSAALSGATTGSGTAASVEDWVAKAAGSVSALRVDSAALHTVVVQQDAAAVPAAAKAMCDSVSSAGQLPAVPDAVDATAWQAALSAFVAGATDALAGASNHPAYYQAAQAQLVQGNQELDVLTAHITANAHR